MAWTFFVVLLAAWSAGLVTSLVTGNFLGGWLHLLLLGAVVVLFLDVLSSGRRTLGQRTLGQRILGQPTQS